MKLYDVLMGVVLILLNYVASVWDATLPVDAVVGVVANVALIVGWWRGRKMASGTRKGAGK